MTTVAAALAAARIKLPASEARLLLGHVLNKTAAWQMTHDDAVLEEIALLSFASLVARRAGGEPAAYLIGKREFYGREFAVSPAVLIPRPETELLVEAALKTLRCETNASTGVSDAAAEAQTILDLGTGSGCVAVTLALEVPQAQVSAIDASEAALQVALQNSVCHGAKLRLLQSDWYAALTVEKFQVIVANPPYIPAADAHLAAGDLRCEPLAALASGPDGLDAIRRIIAGARAHLAPGGRLWLEHGYDQAQAVLELLTTAGFSAIEQHRDLAGIVRVSGGRMD